MNKNKKKQLVQQMRNNILVLAMFIFVIIVCTHILRSSLVEGSNKMGLTLVENYSSAEESNIRACEAILTISVNYIAERERDHVSIEELRGGLYPFMNGLVEMYGAEHIQVYGKAINGTQIVSNLPEIEAMTDYPIEETEYYRGAMEADGEIYLAPAYTDVVTGRQVVTMCKAIPSTGSFLAIDMMFSYFELNNENLVLPKNASYFLVGRKGTLFYYKSSIDQSYREHQELVDSFMEQGNRESGNQVLENIKSEDGIVRNVYFHYMDNGWTAILTIPEEEIISGVSTFNYISVFVTIVGIALVVFQTIHDYRHEKRNQLLLEERDLMAGRNRLYQNAMNSTARAYRAIYYINIKKSRYEMLYPHRGKDSDSGDYNREFVASRFEMGIISEEYKEQIRTFFDLPNILKELKTKDHMELQYKRMGENGKHEWCSSVITVAEMEDGKPLGVTLTIRSIDDINHK
ncbi:MAG: cache domain-containing protein [Lachnospiraceae bacterium]|nr:cache domain-containing protein [Lachnospiraceae bacterium]